MGGLASTSTWTSRTCAGTRSPFTGPAGALKPWVVPDIPWSYRALAISLRAGRRTCRAWMAIEYSRGMAIDNEDGSPRYTTAREMLAGGRRVAVWCPRCKAWREISLAAIMRARRGDESLIGRTWRCRVCAETGQMHVRRPE